MEEWNERGWYRGRRSGMVVGVNISSAFVAGIVLQSIVCFGILIASH